MLTSHEPSKVTESSFCLNAVMFRVDFDALVAVSRTLPRPPLFVWFKVIFNPVLEIWIQVDLLTSTGPQTRFPRRWLRINVWGLIEPVFEEINACDLYRLMLVACSCSLLCAILLSLQVGLCIELTPMNLARWLGFFLVMYWMFVSCIRCCFVAHFIHVLSPTFLQSGLMLC
jgi:hypothetical protein